MNEQWQELKETIFELRDNDGTGTQQETCKFLANLMDVLEKQMRDLEQQPKTGHWIDSSNGWMCSECNRDNTFDTNYCPNCGAKMVEPQESEDKE